MQDDTTNTSTNPVDFPYTGISFDEGISVSPSEPNPSIAGFPVAAGGAERGSTGPWAASPTTTSDSPVHMVAMTDSRSSHPERSASKQVLQVKCIEEAVRTGKNSITTWKPPFEVEEGLGGSLKEIIQRSEHVRAPGNATPLPSGSARYGTTEELFGRLKQAIAGLACLPDPTSALLTYWTISTWFPDALSLAPGLSIIGPRFEGHLVLKTIRNFCRLPIMLTRVDTKSLFRPNWHTTPTLLFYDPHISKQMAATLGCSAARGYMIDDGTEYRDVFGPKAMYLSQEVPADRIPHCSLQVRLQPTSSIPEKQYSSQPNKPAVEDLQNQLLRYRTKNLVRVYNSDFDGSFLTSDTRAIANALGACIIDSPGLQSQLLSLLAPVEDQRQTERSTSLEAVAIEATLNLAHAGMSQMFVHEIASEVNRIFKVRGERLRHSPETIGHELKKLGLSTRRLGIGGKGLAMDRATMARVHDLAVVYGGVGLELVENNLHCPLCIENKTLIG